MPLHLYYDNDNIVKMASVDAVKSNNYKSVSTNLQFSKDLVGKKINFNHTDKIRVAVICNWNDQCGISTYSQYLITELSKKVDDIKIFSEDKGNYRCESGLNVEYTWNRAQSMVSTIKKVLEWKPTVVLIQHEFGIFPKASHFFTMMEMLSSVPTVVTLHSVYEHLDKSVCTSIINNIIVHSESGLKCLRETLGHKRQNIFVVPHGCVDLGEVKPNFNQFGVHYPIIQFGFGFGYKGVDVALEAVSILKKRNSKYNDIFYCYLCSESKHAKNTHDTYYRSIKNKIKELDLESNATIQRGFFTDTELNQFLRTARLSIFPYITDKNNKVYGASGAIRIAMANSSPVIASSSHMFDDLEGVLPRPDGPEELADTIHQTFTNGKYKLNLLEKQRKYIKDNSWEKTADRYLEVFKKVIDTHNKDVILL